MQEKKKKQNKKKQLRALHTENVENWRQEICRDMKCESNSRMRNAMLFASLLFLYLYVFPRHVPCGTWNNSRVTRWRRQNSTFSVFFSFFFSSVSIPHCFCVLTGCQCRMITFRWVDVCVCVCECGCEYEYILSMCAFFTVTRHIHPNVIRTLAIVRCACSPLEKSIYLSNFAIK